MKNLILIGLLATSAAYANDDISSLRGSYSAGDSLTLSIVPRSNSPGASVIVTMNQKTKELSLFYGERKSDLKMGLKSFVLSADLVDLTIDDRVAGNLTLVDAGDNRVELELSPSGPPPLFDLTDYKKRVSKLNILTQMPKGIFENKEMRMVFTPQSQFSSEMTYRSLVGRTASNYSVTQEQTGIFTIRSIQDDPNLFGVESSMISGVLVLLQDGDTQKVAVSFGGRRVKMPYQVLKKKGGQ